jgi:hypothetical protein
MLLYLWLRPPRITCKKKKIIIISPRLKGILHVSKGEKNRKRLLFVENKSNGQKIVFDFSNQDHRKRKCGKRRKTVV